MATRRLYAPGENWHITDDGRILRCTATVKDCKYRHFDSRDDANSGRTRLAATAEAQEIATFHTVLGDSTVVPPPRVRGNQSLHSLRSTAAYAQEVLATSGKRPTSALGDISVGLPSGQAIVLERETYDLKDGGTPQVGVRYYLKHVKEGGAYDQAFVDLNTPLDTVHLQRRLQGFFSRAGDMTASRAQAANILDLYQDTCRRITEVEILARGLGGAMDDLGLDLFSRETPGEHHLSTTYSDSTLQPYDIQEALRRHASKDPYIHGVSLHLSEEIPGTSGGTWTLDRLPEGGWYLGTSIPGDFSSEVLKSAKDVNGALTSLLGRHRVPPALAAEQALFAHQLAAELERGVSNYEHTMEARLGDEAYDFPWFDDDDFEEGEDNPLY